MNPLSHDALPFKFRPLWNAARPVWAHYFPTFPLSIDNRDPPVDYYNKNFLTTTGESGKHEEYGGFLRSRPIPVVPMPGENVSKPIYSVPNMQTEVQLAIARGITGWFVNIMGVTDGKTGYFPWMLEAATAVDPRFGVMPMLDMAAMTSLSQEDAAAIITVAWNGNAERLDDGRLIVGAYNAENKSVDWWSQLFATLNEQKIHVAFIPCLPGGMGDANTLNPVSYGVGGWGTATPGPSAGTNPDKAHAAGLKAMAPIEVQQFRPKGKTYWEASNSVAFRNSWESAIKTGCEYVQIITWSDYSEASQVCPCTDATFNESLGTGFYDLNAYYAAWFATGIAPPITQDVLFFFYRRATSKAVHPNQPAEFTCNTSGGPPEESTIECVAFLTAPGTVVIECGGEVFADECEDGITPLKMPYQPGVPRFTLQRNGSNVFSADGPAQIYSDADGLPSGILDMTYLSGSVTAAGLTSYSLTDD